MTAPRVYYVSAHGVGVEAGGKTLEVRPSPEGWRFLRDWREARPSLRDLLSLVHAMALLLIERGEWSPLTPAPPESPPSPTPARLEP